MPILGVKLEDQVTDGSSTSCGIEWKCKCSRCIGGRKSLSSAPIKKLLLLSVLWTCNMVNFMIQNQSWLRDRLANGC